MESLSPTQQLEPFRSFCAEGRNVKSLRGPQGAATDKNRLKQQACQELHGALLDVLLQLNQFDPPVSERGSYEGLPADHLELLGSFVDSDTEKVCAKRIHVRSGANTPLSLLNIFITWLWPIPRLRRHLVGASTGELTLTKCKDSRP